MQVFCTLPPAPPAPWLRAGGNVPMKQWEFPGTVEAALSLQSLPHSSSPAASLRRRPYHPEALAKSWIGHGLLGHIMSESISPSGDQFPQPKLMSQYRRFGRCDNFRPSASSTLSLGSKPFGTISVDCELLFKKSEWGRLGELPGGIMYLNLNFGSPHGSRLRDATITITLDDQDARLEQYNRGRSLRTLHHSEAPVQVTQWYGPQALVGEKKSAIITSQTKAVPAASVLGYSVGGVGYESSKTFVKESRWSFHGVKMRGERTSTYTTLKWYLTERELDSPSSRNPKIHTAFAFEHSGQPFIMKVQIMGRLQHRHEQLMSKLRFGLDGAREGKVVTLVDFEDYTKFSRGLDGIAKGLPRAMEMANLHDTPVEVRDSLPISFQQVRPPPSWQPSAEHASRPQRLGPNEQQHPLLPQLGRATTIEDGSAIAAQRHGASPTADDRTRAEDWRRTLYPPSTPVPRDHDHECEEEASPVTSASTFFSYENEEKVGDPMSSDASTTAGGEESQSDLDAAPFIPDVGVLRMQVAWGLIMQLFSSILTFLRIAVTVK